MKSHRLSIFRGGETARGGLCPDDVTCEFDCQEHCKRVRDLMKKCPDCQVNPGEQHQPGCDVERCSYCHGQLLICGHIGHDPEKSKWSGEWPGHDECREKGWYAVLRVDLGPAVFSMGNWWPCSPDYPEACFDLNRLTRFKITGKDPFEGISVLQTDIETKYLQLQKEVSELREHLGVHRQAAANLRLPVFLGRDAELGNSMGGIPCYSDGEGESPPVGWHYIFGGPYTSYTMPIPDQDGVLSWNKFDDDEGCWGENESLGFVLVNDEHLEILLEAAEAWASAANVENSEEILETVKAVRRK